MVLPISEGHFINFLCDAKRATYAAKDDKAVVKPVLAGSHQLEYRSGALLYRDIYFGGEYFVGQETVYYNNEPYWGMSYAGGINEELDPKLAPRIYDFLAAALREVPESAPYRGPKSFIQGDFNYVNRILGVFSRFSGTETIFLQENPIYQLHYSGGILKS